ncbi:hypothetical protein PM082_023954 [Marasmius tenuissimus]|nr:hypothetical protein PM082_023954 [Marasmius tenuissimus]
MDTMWLGPGQWSSREDSALFSLIGKSWSLGRGPCIMHDEQRPPTRTLKLTRTFDSLEVPLTIVLFGALPYRTSNLPCFENTWEFQGASRPAQYRVAVEHPVFTYSQAQKTGRSVPVLCYGTKLTISINSVQSCTSWKSYLECTPTKFVEIPTRYIELRGEFFLLDISGAHREGGNHSLRVRTLEKPVFSKSFRITYLA